MPENKEIEFFYFFILSLFLIVVLGISAFMVVFKKRQNELLLKNQLKDEKYKNDLLRKEYENQQSLIRERERISEDIHDDIGGILSAIKLQAEFAKMKIKDDAIAETLRSISENTNLATNNFREMIWCLHTRNDSLIEFVDYISIYTRTLFEKSKIKLEIKKGIIHEDIILPGFIRRQLLLVIKEICNNIIKHSQASKANLELSLQEKTFTIEISDNGIGMPENSKPRNGLLNITKRIESIGGTIHSYLTQGTSYKIFLRLEKTNGVL